MPASLADLPLRDLRLAANEFTGCLPASVLALDDKTGFMHDFAELGPLYCNQMDRNALIALYHSTDGENWLRNENWLTDLPVSEWFGVAEGPDRRVTNLELAGNRLNGEIPREIGSLEKLEVLDLNGNLLRGVILGEIWNLSAC